MAVNEGLLQHNVPLWGFGDGRARSLGVSFIFLSLLLLKSLCVAGDVSAVYLFLNLPLPIK